MYRLLGRKTSGNVQKVVFFFEETGLAYTREDYGRQFENTMTPEYRALNPTSKVPTLIAGEVVIWESNTILRYLAAKERPDLTGATPAERTEVERWMDFLLAAVNPGYVAVFVGSRLKPEERTEAYHAAGKDLAQQLAIIEGHLAGRDWLALGRLTIADIALGPILKRCLGFDIGRPASPGLEAWLVRLEALPSFRKATAG
jgi:glutathione S-transferase